MNRPVPAPAGARQVLDYWFADGMQRRWFRADAALDAEIRARFEPTWQAAAAGRCDTWRGSPTGCLALVIVLDQFPLNMYRGEARAFATEQAAVALTRHALARGFDRQLAGARLAFLYLPLMHSEDIADQDDAVALFERAGLEDNLRFARHHRALIRRFGRFPHRNAVLGRTSSAEELDYLASKEAFTG